MSSSGAGGFCHWYCNGDWIKFSDHPYITDCNRSYEYHWERFKRRLTIYPQSELEYVWRDRPLVKHFCTRKIQWKQLETNAVILLKFYGERDRLLRQLVNTRNDLTKMLPRHVVEMIAFHMYDVVKPKYVEYQEHPRITLLQLPKLSEENEKFIEGRKIYEDKFKH